MKNVVFLCSGNGGNLRFVHKCIQRYSLPLNISGVYADRKCVAVDVAKQANIPVIVDKEFNKKLKQNVSTFKPDIIVTNVHQMVSTENLNHFLDCKWINLHYSLLPAFAGHIGMKAVALARERNCGFVGATTHEVTSELDAGTILQQVVFAADWTQTDKKLSNTVFFSGAVLLLNSLLSAVNFEEEIDYTKNYCTKATAFHFSDALPLFGQGIYEEIYQKISE